MNEPSPRRFAEAAAILRDAVARGAAPAVAAEAGSSSGPLWRDAAGRLTGDPGAPPAGADTVFDLASLTKVVVTATAAMGAVEAGRLRLDDPVGRWLPEWRGADRDDVTVRDLLAHASGLTAYLPFFRDAHTRGRAEFQRAICALPLEYAPRTRSVYSDLGFILLAFILEDAAGVRFADQAAAVAALAAPGRLAVTPPAAWRPWIAPTEQDPWRGRLLVGEVHDENAWALGGVAGHAGLFGSAAGVGRFAALALRTAAADTPLARAATFAEFRRRDARVPGSSRALGWDTMLPTSSCGTLLSPDAVGHTGFTGTSLWLDPARDLYVVLLSNRVHPSRGNETFRAVRPRLHDAVVRAL